ncbi:DUF4426 domain-containing protein [Thalassotalea profundi]|uniref:DUF4426 domain-containing protein n=1 Tax=Thalassotalea profundi TaxID=2036687 RepID=A0ABQ3IE76_9GAMM|nr:DUF4426 domain-containing protein [Thalassotalea profundi]GHE77020.1 hypothetical protein GCM10011501_00520 [Thalassotalea profundi]
MNSLMSKVITFLLLTLALSFHSIADNMQKLGNMNVHYIAISATFLTPEIATAYNIERSRFNGLVNISVMDNTVEGNPAKTVSITGTAKNLTGQKKDLEFTEVKEGDAIYYLGQVNYRNDETIIFDLSITDGKETQTLKFSQKFYVD